MQTTMMHPEKAPVTTAVTGHAAMNPLQLMKEGGVVQRMSGGHEEEEPLQQKANPLQLREHEEDELPVQQKVNPFQRAGIS